MALRRLVLACAAALVAACGPGGSGGSSADLTGVGPTPVSSTVPPGRPLTVMTRNLYVGGDLFLPFVSQDPLGAASTVWGHILASDVPGRMKAVAAEVRTASPDLLGVEEAYRFVVTPLGQDAPVLLDLDFLALLQADLRPVLPACVPEASSDRLRAECTRPPLPCTPTPGDLRWWRVVASQEHTVITIPFVDRGVQIKMIDRDAILVGPGVAVLSTGGGDFAAEYATSLAGVIPVHLKRGWVEADVVRRDVRLTFVDAHLETKDFGPLQSLQAQELLARFGKTDPIVLVGDFNSSPVDPAWSTSPLVPTPYQLIALTLADAWDVAGVGSGLTCCFPGDLRPPGALVERVDLVWLGGDMTPVRAVRTGLEPLAALDDRWPSDHAGVVADLRVQRQCRDDDDDHHHGRGRWWWHWWKKGWVR
jgi:endonuclease/exonuclease/phosphatase family metal-dependent hydrolase